VQHNKNKQRSFDRFALVFSLLSGLACMLEQRFADGPIQERQQMSVKFGTGGAKRRRREAVVSI
jgi:hypothetical protein